MLRSLTLTVALILCLGLADNAWSQEMKIATASPSRIFNEMQETKDLKEKLEAQDNDIKAQNAAKQEELRQLESATKVLNPGSPQHAEKSKQLLEKAIQYDTWKKITQATMQQDQKLAMKLLYDKIADATKAVAEAEKIDLVLAEIDVNFDINQVNDINTLRQLINQRNVLYNSGKLDISPKVILKLDADYKAGGGKK